MITLDSCPMCSSSDTDFITDAGDKFNGERVNICMNCGLVFLSPRMGDEEIKSYYLDDTFSSDFRGEKKRSGRGLFLKKRAEIRWNAIKHHFPDGGNFLDIGCASGEFMELVSRKMVVWGVDPSTGYLNSMNPIESNFGGARVGEFPDESFADEVDGFNVISLFHTLEHVPDPLSLLKSIHDRLLDDGLFFLEYPDVELASQRESLPKTYFQRSHLYDFSGFNLINWINEAGFIVFDVIIPNKNYPNDKNVVIGMIKSDSINERVYSRERALALRNRLRVALDNHNPVNVNFGRNPKIVHIASHTINIGDGAITSGIMSAISDILESPIDFSQIDIVDYISGLSADRINGYDPDFVVVGGGGTIDGHYGRNETGTAFRLPISEIEKVKAPMMFVGLGHNQFRQQEFYHADILSDFILFCESKDIPFSVRMDGSKERLKSLVDAQAYNYIRKIPDPGFFVDPSSVKYSPHFAPVSSMKNLIIQIAPDGGTNRLGSKELYVKFIDSMCEYIKDTMANHGVQVCIATHTYDDLTVPIYIAERIGEHKLREKTRVTGIYHPIFAREFFKTYAIADLVVGMRGHSVICGTGLGTPTIALDTHDKVNGFMVEAGAADWSISPSQPGFMGKLYEKTNELLSTPENQTVRVSQATQQWESIFKSFLKDGLRLS